MSLPITSLLLALPAPPSSAAAHTHIQTLSQDSLSSRFYFFLFLSVSAPVLVTMATGEIQSQNLLAASVIQPSTRIAVFCFCVCVMFPSPTSDAFGQGHHTQLGLGHAPQTVFGHVFFVYLCTCVRACSCLLWNIVQISSACVRIARKKKKGNFTNLVTGKFCFRERYFGLFLGIYVAYTFQDFCQRN